jgi:hypothetical protein
LAILEGECPKVESVSVEFGLVVHKPLHSGASSDRTGDRTDRAKPVATVNGYIQDLTAYGANDASEFVEHQTIPSQSSTALTRNGSTGRSSKTFRIAFTREEETTSTEKPSQSVNVTVTKYHRLGGVGSEIRGEVIVHYPF